MRPSDGAAMKLTDRELHFLGLLMPYGATISRGTEVGRSLHRRYLIELARGRYAITDLGREAYRTGFAKAKAQHEAKAAKEAQLALL